MSPSLSTLRRAVHVTGAVSPRLAGALAMRVFVDPRPRLAVRPDEESTMSTAKRDTLTVRGIPITTYEWGSGDTTVLLVHGWRGRAAQFAPIVRDLVAEGLHVVAFDAPGHGASPGVRTDIRDWIDAIETLQLQHGLFRLIVGHSFGSVAAVSAVRSGTAAARVMTIAGGPSLRIFPDTYSRTVAQLPPRVHADFDRRFHAVLGADAASLRRRFDGVAHPLPPAVELLAVHDEADRQLPISGSEALVGAHAGRALLIRTRDQGHNRIIAADETRDAAVAFALGGLARVTLARAE